MGMLDASSAEDELHAPTDKTEALVIMGCSFLTLSFALKVASRVVDKQSHAKLQLALDVAHLIVLWYSISISMTLFNKWFFGVWAGGGFPYATTVTCLHMMLKWILSRLAWWSSPIDPLPTKTYWRLAVPIGLSTALDIMLSNLSFLFITVTLYTITKSSTNVWNLLFSFTLGHQDPSWRLTSVVVLISVGIALTSYGSTQFSLKGFSMVLIAAMLGSLRWVLTQSLLQQLPKNDSLSTSYRILAVVYYIAPASALGLVPIAAVLDGPSLIGSKFLHDGELFAVCIASIVFSGTLAFGLIFVEIALVKKTSALSLGIAGSFKDVTQVLLAVLVFNDILLPINIAGLIVATTGMITYSVIKNYHSGDDKVGEGDLDTIQKDVKYAPVAKHSEDEDTIFESEEDPFDRHPMRRRSSGSLDETESERKMEVVLV